MNKYTNISKLQGKVEFADGDVQFLASKQTFRTDREVVKVSEGIVIEFGRDQISPDVHPDDPMLVMIDPDAVEKAKSDTTEAEGTEKKPTKTRKTKSKD